MPEDIMTEILHTIQKSLRGFVVLYKWRPWEIIHWPSMWASIEDSVQPCSRCQMFRNKRSERIYSSWNSKKDLDRNCEDDMSLYQMQTSQTLKLEQMNMLQYKVPLRHYARFGPQVPWLHQQPEWWDKLWDTRVTVPPPWKKGRNVMRVES